jgi:hypothetical protein
MVRRRIFFGLRACFDRVLGKNCTTSYHPKVREDVERFEVCTRDGRDHVNMDRNINITRHVKGSVFRVTFR